MKDQNYYLGLDIGTDSVGYAVTDEEYGLLKYKGDPMWGVHLFDPAGKNSDRRAFRTARRRLDRRQTRVKLVQEIFARAIAEKDERFYLRISESALVRDEAHDDYALFADDGYTDREYGREYPTVHHLISELIHNPEPHDVRLVYIACAWLVAHRGHFLFDVSKDDAEKIVDCEFLYRDLADCLGGALPWRGDSETFGNLIKAKSSPTVKYKNMCQRLFGAPKAPKTCFSEEGDDAPLCDCESLLKLLAGGKVAAKTLFADGEYADVPSISLRDPEEALAPVLEALGDDAEVIRRAKALFDWGILADIMGGEKYISDRKVAVYEEHKADLKLLKAMIRKYAGKAKYRELFYGTDDAPSLYSNTCRRRNGSPEVADKFFKAVTDALKDVEPQAEDKAGVELLLEKARNKTLCPKQVCGDNRTIPYQVYYAELKKILANASAYLPFLNEADEEGYVARDKLLSIMEFRVPYYVGPLAGSAGWFVRRDGAQGRILPWNFERQVDYDKSEQAFIDRMTNTCTYLPGASVLPKCSLLHERFQVLNEINTLKINGKRITVELKRRIYDEVFRKRKKVTLKAIKDYLVRENFCSKQDAETLAGADENIKSSLASYHAFKKLTEEKKLLTEKDAEEIIRRSAYTEDRTRFAAWINERFPALPDEDRRYLASLRFKDFARLSKELLCDLYGTESDSESGEAFSVIERMWNENLNLMEIIASDDFTYKKQIEEANADYYGERTQSREDYVRALRLPNAVKRPIVRTLDVLDDVVRVTGREPSKIFVEMARGGTEEQKGKRTTSRYAALKELYAKCKLEDVRELSEELDKLGGERERALQGDALFLYYMQLGRSMYSGERIRAEDLQSGLYNVDHIYPRTKVKDDSVLNNKVLVTSSENATKGDKYPISAEIRHKMFAWWRNLLDAGFITREKFDRLTRCEPFGAEEEWGFINRQIVETRQSTKALAELLRREYPNTEVVYVKAGLVPEFRQEFDLLKSRGVNDLHHAKDAYLNVVVGNVYNERFTKKWFLENRDKYNIKVSTLFSHPVSVGDRTVWGGSAALGKVQSMVRNKNAVHFTRYAYCQSGGFFDQMPKSKNDGDLVPRKKDLPAEKYGGYPKASVAFFVLARYRVKKNVELTLVPIRLLQKAKFERGAKFAEDCVAESLYRLGKKPEAIELPLGTRRIKINTVFECDGVRMCLRGKTGVSVIMSLCEPLLLPYESQKYVKRLETFAKNKKNCPNIKYDREHDKISKEENLAFYDVLCAKLNKPPYSHRPNNGAKTVEEGRERFAELGIREQVDVLLEIFSLFGRETGGHDLSAIGGKKAAAALGLSIHLSNWKKQYNVVRIADETAAGLAYHVTDNLLDLL